MQGKGKTGYGVRNWQKKASQGNRRISVWVSEDMDKWKDKTQMTWGQILKAGIEFLGAPSGSPGVAAHDVIKETSRKLQFFIDKTKELQAQIDVIKLDQMKEESPQPGPCKHH